MSVREFPDWVKQFEKTHPKRGRHRSLGWGPGLNKKTNQVCSNVTVNLRLLKARLPYHDGQYPLMCAKAALPSLSCFCWYFNTETRRVTNTGGIVGSHLSGMEGLQTHLCRLYFPSHKESAVWLPCSELKANAQRSSASLSHLHMTGTRHPMELPSIHDSGPLGVHSLYL